MSIIEKMIEAHARPNHDIFGTNLEVGMLVRSFDHPLLTLDGKILGMETEGSRVQYVEGVLESIGDFVIEGCARYTVRVTKEVCRVDGKDRGDFYGVGHRIYPPLNGTPNSFDGVCFGVVAVCGD